MPIEDNIGINKAGIKLEHSNKNGSRQQQSCAMVMRKFIIGIKNPMLLAIFGDENYNQSWHELWEDEATILFKFQMYLVRIINQLTVNHPDRSFLFSNGQLEYSPQSNDYCLICNAGYRFVFSAPYWSCDAVIEYVFYTIHSFLLYFWNGLETMQDLENTVESNIKNNLGLFSNYVRHVGFRDQYIYLVFIIIIVILLFGHKNK